MNYCFKETIGYGYTSFINFEVNFKGFTLLNYVCLILFYLIKTSFLKYVPYKDLLNEESDFYNSKQDIVKFKAEFKFQKK